MLQHQTEIDRQNYQDELNDQASYEMSQFAQEEFDAMKDDISQTGSCNIGGIIGAINYTVRDIVEECNDDDLTGLLNDAIASVYINSNPTSIEMQSVISDIKLVVEKMVNAELKEKALKKEDMYS